jgi:putative transport protein
MTWHVMKWLFGNLRTYPEIAISLALAFGFYLGELKFGKFSPGNVTGVLVAGVLIGQLTITVSPKVKPVFYLMLLLLTAFLKETGAAVREPRTNS